MHIVLHSEIFVECRKEVDGRDYKGTWNYTITGRVCQAWNSQSPHKHSIPNVPEDENYCRNPDGEARLWCYTTDPEKRWDYCHVPLCGQFIISVL